VTRARAAAGGSTGSGAGGGRGGALLQADTDYADWVDHSLPALDGLSPRDATANPALRARLALLLKEMEELEERSPAGQRFDPSGIRRQLDRPGR
jgi:hypothetical protein